MKNREINSIIIITSIIFCGCGMLLIGFYREQKDNMIKQRELNQISIAKQDEEAEIFQSEYEAYFEENEDMVGWISIPGTNIHYPVMKYLDEFYLNHNFEKELDPKGLPFLDNERFIIYGHNVKGGLIFHNLRYYREEDFLREYPFIYFETRNKQYVFKITTVIDFTIQEMPIEIFGNDNGIVLITCNNIKDGRLAVIGESIDSE